MKDEKEITNLTNLKPRHSQEIHETNQCIDDFEPLSKQLEEDGYLLLRGLVDVELVATIKEDILSILRKRNISEDDGTSEPLWSGGPPPTDDEYMAVYDSISSLKSLKDLAESPDIVKVMAGLLGSSVQVWQQLICRMIFPDPQGRAPMGLNGHQDANPKFGYMVRNFYTCWLPLMEIDANLGGLEIAPGSHKKGILVHPGTLASSTEEAKKREAGLAAEDFEWVSSDYQPGDAVIFTSLTVHRGSPNQSDRIRLSCDFRYQAQGEWTNWMSNASGPECRRVSQQIDAVINSRALYVTTGAQGEILEEIRRRMLEEKNMNLQRAQQLVVEIQGQRKA